MTAVSNEAASASETYARPMAQNLDDWQRLIYKDKTRPPTVAAGEELSELVVRHFHAYNSALGPLPTDDVAKVREAVTRAHFENEHASLAGQRAVVIDGPPLVGKTHAALGVAFQETRAIWDDLDDAFRPEAGAPAKQRSIPWVYVEVTKASHGFGILAGMHRFCGIPQNPRDNTEALMARLRDLAGPLGTRGVIIDDSHGLAGGRTQDSATLADTLKGIITGLPFTVVIIGADLAASGFLNGPFGEQVRYRSMWTQLGNWPVPTRNGPPGPWERLAATLTRHLAFPRGASQCRLNSRDTLTTLIEGADRRPGLAIDWAKAAAHHAITNDKSLDKASLEATYRIERGKWT